MFQEKRLGTVKFGKDVVKNYWKQNENDMNPRAVKLKKCNMPRPFTGPTPKVTISFSAFPHILERLLDLTNDKAVLLSLRATSKTMVTIVDRMFARHLVVSSPTLELEITSQQWGSIPSFRFSGPVMIGTASISDESKSDPDMSPEDLISTLGSKFKPNPIEVWFKIHPRSANWFGKLVSGAKTVEICGASMGLLFPLTRAQQAAKLLDQPDAKKRVFVDKLPITLLRMHPNSLGQYWEHVPFVPKFVEHVVHLKEPFKESWIGNVAPIPEGAVQYMLTMHVDPNVHYGLTSLMSFEGNPVVYPSSCKRVIVNPILLAPHGRITDDTLDTLRNILMLVFFNCRHGGRFVILNLHHWGATLQNLVLPLVYTFAVWWYKNTLPTQDKAELKELLKDRLMFVRYGGDPWKLGDLSRFTTAHPDGTLSIPRDPLPTVPTPEVTVPDVPATNTESEQNPVHLPGFPWRHSTYRQA